MTILTQILVKKCLDTGVHSRCIFLLPLEVFQADQSWRLSGTQILSSTGQYLISEQGRYLFLSNVPECGASASWIKNFHSVTSLIPRFFIFEASLKAMDWWSLRSHNKKISIFHDKLWLITIGGKIIVYLLIVVHLISQSSDTIY